MPAEEVRNFSEKDGNQTFPKGFVCAPISRLSTNNQSHSMFESSQDGGDDNYKVIQHIRSVLLQIPDAVKHSVISKSGRSVYSAMTYQQLGEHIISLRTEYIQKLARPVIMKFFSHPRNFNIFNEPVDPVIHNLPHYFDVIQHPMDLGTIKCRLNSSFYESLSDCFDDVRLVFNNAIKFNGVESFVGKAAKDMLAEFEIDVAGLEDKNNKNSTRKCTHSCSDCSGAMCLLCGEKCLKLENSALFCQGSCAQKIKKGGLYFVSKDALNVWCQKCYQSLTSVLGTYLDPDTKLPVTLLKKDLLKRRHDEQTSEPWVECDRCGYWLHQICSLYTDAAEHHDDQSFSCPICILDDAATLSNNTNTGFAGLRPHVIPVSDSETLIVRDGDSVCSHTDKDISSVETSTLSPYVKAIAFDEHCVPFTARSLPVTKLSNFLESLVKELLIAYGFNDTAQSICVRVTSNVQRNIEINVPLQEFSRQLYGHSLPHEIPYRQKCIQLYQDIDGISVVLFSLYVHEFDRDCPAPNTSTVYIAYLDSTDYFRPAQMRSFVYQEIVVGYLLWARARGFEKCHIWACPPQRGDNFIFWCHPAHQRTPSRDRLNAWYHSILSRGRRLGIHQGVDHLWNNFFAHLPSRSSETSTREASKRRHSVVAVNATTASMPRKYNKSNKGNRTVTSAVEGEPTNEDTNDNDYGNSKSETKIFPPIFEGDYWVLEITRFYNSAIQRWKNADKQSTNHVKTCRSALRGLLSSPLSIPFREPVDPVALNIPTYFDVISQPMDLSTVRRRLESNQYETIFSFAKDVRLTFTNAMLFNPPGHPIHQQADTMLKDIDRRLSDIAAEARKLYNFTCTSQEAPISDDDLLLRCKLAPITNTQSPAVTNQVEDVSPSVDVHPVTPGSRRSKRQPKQSNVSTLSNDIVIASKDKKEKDEFSADIKLKEFQREAAQQSPTSVLEGRKEELFLCDPKSFKLARSVSDEISVSIRSAWCTTNNTVVEENNAMDVDNVDVQLPPSKMSPSSPQLFLAHVPLDRHRESLTDAQDMDIGLVASEDNSGLDVTEEEPTINSSALAALSATELNSPTINVSCFLSDLSKSIQRLNDDLFVLRFLPPSHNNVIPLEVSESQVQQKLVAPTVGVKSRKVVNSFVPQQSMLLLQNLLRDTSDPDPLMDNPLVDSRHTFLEMCQFKYMQFDTLRRAKHSSLQLVYHQLHTCDKRCGPVCSHCGERIRNLRWHCEQCAGYEICQPCMLAKEKTCDTSSVPCPVSVCRQVSAPEITVKEESEKVSYLLSDCVVKVEKQDWDAPAAMNIVQPSNEKAKLKKKLNKQMLTVQVPPTPASVTRETRRRDSQLTQRREDSMFVYTPIISTHRLHQQQQQQLQLQLQPETQPKTPSSTTPNRRSQRQFTQSSASNIQVINVSNASHANNTLTSHKNNNNSYHIAKKVSLASSPTNQSQPQQSSVSLSCCSTDTIHTSTNNNNMELLANDFGVFPGHPHPLIPYRVSYM